MKGRRRSASSRISISLIASISRSARRKTIWPPAHRQLRLAAKMQTAAKEAFDISGESRDTQRMYGIEDANAPTREFGTRCLSPAVSRTGVRFVQIFSGNQEWDHHGGIADRLPLMTKKNDQGSAALVRDLKQRGLLDSTLVHWGRRDGATCRDSSSRERGRWNVITTPTRLQHVASRGGVKGASLRCDRRDWPSCGRERGHALRLSRHAVSPLWPRLQPRGVPTRQRRRFVDRGANAADRQRYLGVKHAH